MQLAAVLTAAVCGAGSQQSFAELLALSAAIKRLNGIGWDGDDADRRAVVNPFEAVAFPNIVPPPDGGGDDGLPTLGDQAVHAAQ